ncbi:hypothetical protein CRUP_004252 [Coryphaenoides rupestris]|nr:hypothetical protein CRUP_004252 [Coryphaenoides rupestris]
MSVILTVALFVTFLYSICIKYIYWRHRRALETSLKRILKCLSPGGGDGVGVAATSPHGEVRALLVTAHPDDESLFFAPTVIRLVEEEVRVHLLCLSQGNYYNQGTLRREELFSSCAVLGIPASQVTVLDHKDLPDDPNAEWSIPLVSSLVKKHIRSHSFNMVLTFDGRGVSGHANHTAVHEAVSHLASSGQVSEDCCLLSLVTVGLFRKYVSFLELPVSWLWPSALCCITGPRGYAKAKAAMSCHVTQMLWFRHLYVLFSRYMLVNTFHMLPRGPRNLKIY